MNSLFKYCALVFALSACNSSSDAQSDVGEEHSERNDGGGESGILDGTKIRVMAANTTSGGSPSYKDPGIRIFQGLHPDVVLIQEFNAPDGDLRALVDTAFGPDFQYYVEPRAGGIPNGVVSRYPIVASGVWTDGTVPDRGFAWAHIDVPGAVDLWGVSLHLLTTGGSQRDAEASLVVSDVRSVVPAGDFLVVGGDLNAENSGEAMITTLGQIAVVAGPYPADQLGNVNSSINRNRPHDWLFANAAFDGRKTPVVIGASTFNAGLVFDSRVYTPLSDVAPIELGDSNVSGMQHMPIVRDFILAP